jgi:hypothetical protein
MGLRKAGRHPLGKMRGQMMRVTRVRERKVRVRAESLRWMRS